MGRVIVFANTKGGVGKSMLAVHLVVWLHDRARRVALLDTDDQATASTWLARVPRQQVLLQSPPSTDNARRAEQVRQAVGQLRCDHEFVVVDTQGIASPATSAAILQADLAVVPIQASATDIWPIEQALTAIRLSQRVHQGRPEARLVLNQTSAKDPVARSLRRLTVTHGIPIARTSVPRLNAYRDAPGNATVVTRLGDQRGRRAAQVLDALFDELLSLNLAEPRGCVSYE